ncbi:hypothetical protein HPB48_023232 [Haemaphysalis longicornis]|uniref:Uncharacterized protein n=1 Tax=Haemaphysalis longicornis TaxID=44386 RepID=A0A9J6H7I6_HAELO|nr:hypothetical protein HPB48_023232 [Haemaphysalis longicornis]
MAKAATRVRRITKKNPDPNPLFTKWLQEWKDAAVAHNSKAQHVYGKVHLVASGVRPLVYLVEEAGGRGSHCMADSALEQGVLNTQDQCVTAEAYRGRLAQVRFGTLSMDS